MVSWNDLIERSLMIEEAVSKIQDGDNIGLPQKDVEQLFNDYINWYMECLIALKPTRMYDLLVNFQSYYEGHESSPHIREFFEAPTEKRKSGQFDTDTILNDLYSVMRKPSSGESSQPQISSWKYPYEETFRKYIIRQRKILAQARAVSVGPQPQQQNTPPQQSGRPHHSDPFYGTPRSEAVKLFDLRRLHPEVQKHGRSHFQDHRYFQAVSECSKAYIRYVGKKARSNEDGTKLMQSVLAPGKSLRLNALRNETERNEQLGLMHLSTGIVFSARNPVQHEPELDYPISQEDALDFLSFISFLYRQIDKTHYESNP